jgi:hypothetical protein
VLSMLVSVNNEGLGEQSAFSAWRTKYFLGCISGSSLEIYLKILHSALMPYKTYD